MKNKLKNYQDNVKRILFRDYLEENERSREVVEGVLEKCALEKYLKHGYSEEAAAHEICEKKLLKYKEKPR